MLVPAAVTSRHPPGRLAGPSTVTGRSWPRSSNVIGPAITPSRVSVHRSARAGPASAPMTCEVYPWPGEKKTGFMTVAGVGPSTITVPRGAVPIASRAVAM